ncbi:hypothetical protein Q4I32_002814 [Leishmania shawi]|uniref:Uncharacterized protein n=1 Tax=Leishmania shawi TaxID=5680 RepID=A0AAW3BZ81_9TRYP
MQAYIDSICSRKPPSTAPPVRPTKNALLLQSHSEAKRRQRDQAQADGTSASLRHSYPQPRAAAAKWPLKKAPPLGPPPRPLARRPPSPAAHDELTRTPAASFVAAASPWHPLFTSPSPSPSTSPQRQQKGRHTSEADDTAGTRETHWPTLSQLVETDKSTSVAVAAHSNRRLYNENVMNGEDERREVDAMHSSATVRSGGAAVSPARPWRSVWALWKPPSHEGHLDVVQSGAASPYPTTSRPQYPLSSSCVPLATHPRSEVELLHNLRLPAVRPSMTTGTPSGSTIVAISGQSPTSLPRVVDVSEAPQWRHPVLAPQQQQQQLAGVDKSRVGYYVNANCPVDVDGIATTERRPASPPSRPSLPSLFSSGFFDRGPEAAMRRRAERHSKVAHRAENLRAQSSSTVQSAASSFTKQLQPARQPRPGADHRCRDVDNYSLRDLQDGLYTRLQRRLHNLATSSSDSASPMDSKATARSTSSTPLLTDMDAAVRLWRDTRLAFRQQVKHRSCIHNVQRSATRKGQLPSVQEDEEDVVMNGVVRRILAERAASRAYLFAGAAAANREESTP